MSTFVILFRGINVGGRNRVAMADLRRLFEDIGCRNVETHIQSGNVVCWCDDDRTALIEMVAAGFEQTFGFSSGIVVRTAGEFRAIAAEHPLGGDGLDPRYLMVAFLEAEPEAVVADLLDPEAYRPDRFLLKGREVFLSYPGGSGRSKLTNNLLESKLGVRATTRNWNTVRRLAEMVGDADLGVMV